MVVFNSVADTAGSKVTNKEKIASPRKQLTNATNMKALPSAKNTARTAETIETPKNPI